MVYAALVQKHRPSPLPGGITFGLGLWTTSYLGWLLALGILWPVTEHPPRRNALMLTAHVVWGSVLDLLVDSFSGAALEEFCTAAKKDEREKMLIPHPDAVPYKLVDRPFCRARRRGQSGGRQHAANFFTQESPDGSNLT